MAIDENKQKALAAALGQIEKQFGKGSIMRLGEDRSMDVETISTGSLSLDIALGAGGLPMGRSPRRSVKVKPVRLSMLNTRWTQSTHVNWASISTTCCAPSRTPASRHWKSVTPWRVLAQ